MRSFHELGLAGLLLGAAACSGPNGSAGPIIIQANEAIHDEGSFVMATIKSLSSEALQYSPCFYRIEEPGPDGSWREVYEDSRPCPAVLEFLKGHATRQIELSLPADLPAGSYRIRFPDIGRYGNEGEDFVIATQIGGEFSLGQ